MSLLAMGVSYRRAPLRVLERMAFADDELTKAYRRLADDEVIGGAVLLSTCNRVEVYAEVPGYHEGFLALKRFLAESRELPYEEFAEPLYAHWHDDAAEHLFGVAAGLDSMVLGEPQILGQVRAAVRRAEREAAAGPSLSAAFAAAVRAGRRVRAETAVGASPAAFVAAGATLAERALGGLAGRAVAIVGAGEMAEVAATHLAGRGVGPVAIVNRSPAPAARLARRVGGRSLGMEQLAGALVQADLVVACTGAAELVIVAEDVRAALRASGRAGRPMFLLDLAVPRDVDPRAGSVPGAAVADLDGLATMLEGGGPEEEVARAWSIVGEEVARFARRRRAADLAPLIRTLEDAGERARAAELARHAGALAGLTPEQREAVEALSRGIVAKLLHRPIVALRESGGPEVDDALVRAAEALFGIGE